MRPLYYYYGVSERTTCVTNSLSIQLGGRRVTSAGRGRRAHCSWSLVCACPTGSWLPRAVARPSSAAIVPLFTPSTTHTRSFVLGSFQHTSVFKALQLRSTRCLGCTQRNMMAFQVVFEHISSGKTVYRGASLACGACMCARACTCTAIASTASATPAALEWTRMRMGATGKLERTTFE